ncbi:MAG: ATP-binding cassette domain-containing protein [Mesorhizobium sp.]|nr:MAG: ATP-binding cassette domain-containing protein [Mesorhizobium sp.]TIQ09308.1 MAG: ATP-binding cassette domain-containing protein [Mesorhizobium sp.]TIR50062.1 MAG: ATP-binding cassette domain-containing protein [Mesorhizobium sp.]TJV96017.1 MAG: ATP-binding cassette domain-containing protein [Mesorhizobium sp.]
MTFGLDDGGRVSCDGYAGLSASFLSRLPLLSALGICGSRPRLSMLGFVFQFHFLLPEFTARENVEIPMRKLGRLTRPEMRERAGELLSPLGLGEHLDKRPDQLSGGQRQRVAVARSLANDPPLILADEPTGSLDSKSSEQVFAILENLVRERGKTVVAVTHDLDMAARMDRRIHIVDGKIG